MAGTIGSDRRRELIVVGRPMIAAARIQRMTRLFDAHIIAGEETFDAGEGPRRHRELGTAPAQGHQAARRALRDPRPGAGVEPGLADPAGGPVEQTTILIVDDEPRVLDALEAVLAAEFRILRAGSGPAALDLLARRGRGGHPHRLQDARDDRRRAAPREPGRSRRTRSGIVLTAYTDVDSLMEAINTGHIYHFVAKPWDPNELLVVLRRAAERHALAQENARLREELELAYNAVRRQVAEIRARPTAFDARDRRHHRPARGHRPGPQGARRRRPPCCCAARPAPARSCSPG